MAEYRNIQKRKSLKENTLDELSTLFGNILDINIIDSVANSCKYDVIQSTNLLLDITNNLNNNEKELKTNKYKSKRNNNNSNKKMIVQKDKISQSASANALSNKSKKQLEIDRVTSLIQNGYKVLILLRGLPGSGKSTLAKLLVDNCITPPIYNNHILSTDDYFIKNNCYYFNPNKLSDAHGWNHNRAFKSMSKGVSPVIIDNTNLQMWEMKPYAMMATDYGYYIEILEPDTYWCFNENELAKRNIHGINKLKIKDLLLRYQKNITPLQLLQSYNLTYKFQKPPQMRLTPPLSFFQNNECNDLLKAKSVSALDVWDTTTNDFVDFNRKSDDIDLIEFKKDNYSPIKSINNKNNNQEIVDKMLMIDTENNQSEILKPSNFVNLFNDLDNSMPINEKIVHSEYQENLNKTSTKDSATYTELINFELIKENSCLPDGMKIITCYSRDINFGQLPKPQAIPKKIKINRSCMTDDDLIIDNKNSFKDLIDLFPNIPKYYLFEIYEKCQHDFNWTVDVLLEDNQLLIDNKEESDDDSYEINDIPLNNLPNINNEYVVIDEQSSLSDDSNYIKEKKNLTFKQKIISEESKQLKKCLESKIEINKEAYSDHILKVKQLKFRSYEPQPSCSKQYDENYSSDIDSDSDFEIVNYVDNDLNEVVELNIGDSFIKQLENHLGDAAVDYPKGFQPVIQIPMSLVKQLYTFYLESVYQQMETQKEVLDQLAKEDEEFAKKLQNQKENKIIDNTHIEDKHTPNLLNIMHEEAAFNNYIKETESWKNNLVDTLAAKLIKQKLFQIFPNIEHNVLIEILHAYNYDYKKTVDTIITSVGPPIVDDNINEPPLSKELITEMQQDENDFSQYIEETEDETPPTVYRKEANEYLKKREDLYKMAQNYYQRGMNEVAQFYSALARKQTLFYERANNKAAIAFLYENSNKLQTFNSIDLHYLYVKEAIAALDIFLDKNITLMLKNKKNSQSLTIITGRGKNSLGGISRIKPAVMARLRKRKIGFTILNPGLLKVKINRNSLMSNLQNE